MTFSDILQQFRLESATEKDKGTKFERLMQKWLRTDPRYNELTKVWLWEEFPGRKDFGGSDIGIDLVAKDEVGEYWAIQCKCYQEKATIDKAAVDSFIATSGKSFTDTETFQTTAFSHRLWISTTNKWGANAEETIKGQNPAVNRLSLSDLEASPVDWDKLMAGSEGKSAMLEGKQLRKHQLEAISRARDYYKDHDRGKLIMACGTGKTFTALRMVEDLLGGQGLVLFMVPSISLLGQSLNAWMSDAKNEIKAICICSDNKAQRKSGNDSDEVLSDITDLALPATTNTIEICRRLHTYRKHKGLTVVFSTYQSIDAISEAQNKVLTDTHGEYGVFDFIICDEAHRTTGVILPDAADESNFTKIHNDENVWGKKRLYMTATPRLYGSSAKVKASQKDCVLCSMDNDEQYGEEFYRVNFSYAVQNGLLTDYKVFVLTVGEEEIAENIAERIRDPHLTEYNYDDTGKLIGVINGLSKIVRGDDGRTWEADPKMMRRAVAFCNATGKTGKSKDKPGTSTIVTKTLPIISRMLDTNLNEEDREHVVSVDCRHIDGSMNSMERNEIMQWLRDESDDPRECRVVTNVRCLSEGVDVPALDAVLFLSARNSQVDVVQSVGRVMRNFRKGEPGEKKYGYIIIPIVTPAGVKAEDALNNNTTFECVWQILNALRSHDDAFNAEVNKIALNKDKAASKVLVGGVKVGTTGIGNGEGVSDPNDAGDAKHLSNQEVARQLELHFGDYQSAIYAKLVEKCGDRMYWENWAKDVAVVATKFIERISRLVDKGGRYEYQFAEFLSGLQKNLNPTVSLGEAVEMLAQHMICRPVFDALFAEYQFVKNNAVSVSMQRMLDILHDEAFEKDTQLLDSFYESVKMNVGEIDNLEGKQTIIKNLYEQFFKGAFPKTVDRLGIVYTPIECVDFIIHSVDDILRTEFDSSLTEENVHILDPFTGTGTFMTRLLQSGCIKPEDLERKYRNEIHCNELVLLAYYVADINIEAVFHDLTKREQYLPFDGICLTDTFQMGETNELDAFSMIFPQNSDRLLKQRKIPIRVIIGNPPYSAGQKSANDNAQNVSYPKLDSRIAKYYVAGSSANLNKAVYDTYIKAFRWSTDRLMAKDENGSLLDEDGSGIIAFISNGGWLDGNAQDGFRQCIESEFTDIYVLNLRGNCRTSGETRRKEGDGVFGLGSRTPITITILVRNPKKHKGGSVNKAHIHYHDIGDYLSREQKLAMVKGYGSISSGLLDWHDIVPNEKNDWINQRGGVFDDLVSIESGIKTRNDSKSFFAIHSLGIATNKDSILYDFGLDSLKSKISNMVSFFNEEKEKCNGNKDYEFTINPSVISWTDMFKSYAIKGEDFTTLEDKYCISSYRPFCKQNFIYQKNYIQRTYQQTKLLPEATLSTLQICISGIGVTKPFSCIITDKLPDLEYIGKSQCFPLYYYEENKQAIQERSLFDDEVPSTEKYIRRDGITDWVLKEMKHRYATKNITKDMIFYYVYGLLHSEEYRCEFEADLKKSLPRIPIVERLEDFLAFSKAGEKLANLHLKYEEIEAHPAIEVNPTSYKAIEALKFSSDPQLEIGMVADGLSDEDLYEIFTVEKMRFGKVDGTDKNGKPKKVDDKSVIIYNCNITLKNIPDKAYEYVVNGKSAIEWIMERYAVSVDAKSGIKNDPNDWSREHHNPRYIFDLLLSIINVSCKTVDIVRSLPHLSCCTSTEENTAKVLHDDQGNTYQVNGELHLHTNEVKIDKYFNNIENYHTK